MQQRWLYRNHHEVQYQEQQGDGDPTDDSHLVTFRWYDNWWTDKFMTESYSMNELNWKKDDGEYQLVLNIGLQKQ
jgi:hypothetical protein